MNGPIEKLKEKIFDEMMKDETGQFKQYKPYYISYNNIVDKTADFLKNELKVEDPITASIIFEYLLWNGYLSNDNTFQFNGTKIVDDFDCLGADVVRGYGTCLNISHFLSDVLNKMNYKSYPTVCLGYITKKGRKNNVYPPIKQNGSEEMIKVDEYLEGTLKKIIIVLEKIASITANHVIVSTEYNDIFYGADPTNLCFITYKNKRKFKSVNFDMKFKLRPYTTRLINNDKLNETSKIFENKNNKPSFLEKELIKNKYIEEVKRCDSKKALVDDFHKECLEDIETVYNTLGRIKIVLQEQTNNDCKTLTKKIR